MHNDPVEIDPYKKLFNLSNDMLCITNTDGYFLKLNPAFSKTLGYSEQVLLSQPFIEFVHPNDKDATLVQITQLNGGQSVSDFENRYQHSDGHYINLSWSATLDPDTGIIYAVARDVTEQQNIKSRLDQIQNALHQETILAQTDARGVIIDVNDKFCEISGYTRDEIIGKTHKLVNSGYHSKTFFREMWNTISSGRIWSGTIKNRKKNGLFYYVQSILIPILNGDGRITNYLAIRQDITQSMVNESKLTKTLQILNETGSIANVGGWELDVETGELTWTDETFNILEVEQRDGQRPLLVEGINLFTPEHQPVIEKAIQRAIDYGEAYSLELKALSAKGNEFWVFTNGKPSYENGKIVSLSGTIQNIHGRKMSEINYNKERQKGIHNAKLASLGELAASVAHEINNPLGIILGNAQLMMVKEMDRDKRLSKLTTIEKSCERISHIVKSLRKFSRTDTEKVKTVVNLADIINEAITLTTPKLRREFVKLRFEPSKNCQVLCDEIEIEQVVINLINNAIDAVKTLSEKWITISIKANETSVQMKLTDSGSGIPIDIHEKIYEPFYTLKSAVEGTGLGLSIVKGILEDHNAQIYIDTRCQNTCFVVDFSRQ